MASSSMLLYRSNSYIQPTTCSISSSDPFIIRQPFSLKQNHSSVSLKSNPPSLVADAIVVQSRSITKSLASVWREIHGQRNWEDLVEPLNPLLQAEIIRYGEFVTACYKAFDLDPNSKRFLNCKYGKKTMLPEVGLPHSGYQVTKYIYATAPDIEIPFQTGSGSCGRWIGYVAVSDDKETTKLGRKDILVTFRGTVTNPEWIANLMSSLTPAQFDPINPRPGIKVEAGFLSLYTSNERTHNSFGLNSCREQLLSEISRLLRKYKDQELSITLAGHSLGSSLALLLAYDIAELGLNKGNESRNEIPITVFSFGGPRVGNLRFKERCEELGVKVLRIVNANDPVTKLPGVILNENFRVFNGYEFPWSCSCYVHVGVELLIDFFKINNPSCVHDLESYIGLLKSCPKTKSLDNVDDEGLNLKERAKGFLLGCAIHNFDALHWINVAIGMLNLVQTQWT